MPCLLKLWVSSNLLSDFNQHTIISDYDLSAECGPLSAPRSRHSHPRFSANDQQHGLPVEESSRLLLSTWDLIGRKELLTCTSIRILA